VVEELAQGVCRPRDLWIRSRWYVGVDLGQSHDPTALCVLEERYATVPPGAQGNELERLKEGLREYRPPLLIRHLERLPLGMPYPDQVNYIMDLVHRPPLREPQTFIDYTGVGRPVFDLFAQARLPRLNGVTITGGNEIQRRNRIFSVPKQILMSKLQAQLHTGLLKVAAGIPDAPALLQEMQDFRVTFTSAGNAVFNARQGAHDDLVLAVAMSVFGATQPYPVSRLEIGFAI